MHNILLFLSLLALASNAQHDKDPVPSVLENPPDDSEVCYPVSIMFNYIDSPISDIVWCSEKKNVIFILTQNNTLYRSEDDGFSGHRVTEHLQRLGQKELGASKAKVGEVTAIIQSPVDKSMILFVGSEGINWITEDCGTTFRVINQGRPMDDFKFHPTERTWLLASRWTKCEDFKDKPCRRYKELYLSRDLGNQWEAIAKYVFQFSWGQVDGTYRDIPKERVVVVLDPEGEGHQKLSGWNEKLYVGYSDDFFKTSMKTLVRGGNKFLLTKLFMFVVQVGKEDSEEVTLLVGDPRDKQYTLRPIELPVKRLMEHSYTILDTTENSVFLHINHQGEKSTYGNVYVSDSTGVRYSMALNGNVRNMDGQCDFDRVQGVEGIYMANIYEKDAIKRFKTLEFDGFPQQHGGSKKTSESGKTVGTESSTSAVAGSSSKTLDDFKKTVISFDKGGMWQSLTPPLKDVKGDRIVCRVEEECSLHLHSISNTNFGPFYTTVNSLGIILGTGNVGRHLSNRPDEINTYLSRDAGLTWFEIAKGSHIYEIGDHGSLIVMAPDQHATTEVLYSWNEGLVWEILKISEVPIQVQNIIIEPTNTAEKFLIYGRTQDGSNKGVVIAADFTPLHQTWCKGHDKPDTPESDYETWSPNGKISPNCLMGRQISFIRRKREAECFNSEEHEQWKVLHNCQCTEEDWECDYGFVRVGAGPCLPIDDKMSPHNRSPPEQCDGYYYITQGYRKVAGNTCEGGINHDPIRVLCPGTGAVNSKNFVVLMGLVSVVVSLVWMSNKENSEKLRTSWNNLYKKMKGMVPRRQQGPVGFHGIGEVPDTLRDEEDEFGKIVFEETEDKAEPIEDSHLLEYTQGKKMTERRGIETASRMVPTLSGPGERKKM